MRTDFAALAEFQCPDWPVKIDRSYHGPFSLGIILAKFRFMLVTAVLEVVIVDTSEFRRLAMVELDAVHRMAFHLARESEEASDLVQETYLRAFRAEQTFELRDRGIRPWLFKILHNVFYTRLGKQRRQPTIMDDMQFDNAAGELDHPAPAWDLASLDWEQVDERLKRAISDLDPRYRDVLLLWAVEGLKYREVADVLDVPLGTVMSRLYRARALLSERLADVAAEHGIAIAD